MSEILLIVLLIISTILLVLLYLIYTSLNNNKAYDKIERSLMLNHQDISENKIMSQNLSQNYDLLLKEMIKTKEYLGISDAKLNMLSSHISNMNDIMVNNKRRGNFGEFQLYHLLSLYLGESTSIYKMQYQLSNQKICDAALLLPDSHLIFAIDSKFPMDAYLKIVEDNTNNNAKIEFRKHVKKHINDISNKYIIKNETLEEAIMFIPSEAIYLYICQEESSLIEEAFKKHVLITSPSTLMGVAFTLLNITKDFNRSKNLEKLETTIINLKEDSKRMVTRYEKVLKNIETVNKQIEELGISIVKIDKKIDKVYEGK